MLEFGGGFVEFLPSLKVEKEVIRKVDYMDLENFCVRMFGLSGDGQVSILAENEWTNDNIYTLHIDGIEFEDLDDEFGEGTYDALSTLRDGGKVERVPSVQSMLEYASNLGLIEKGEYTVEVYY